MTDPRLQPAIPMSGTVSGRSMVRVGACLGVLGLVSACATTPKISATQEAAQYEQRAHRNYAAPGPSSDPWGPYITEAANRFDVPERWIREVMRVESGGRTELNGMPITSGAGAMGLMQVMPATYDELRGRYTLGDDPYDPHNSILAGAAYIRELYDLYGSPGFLAAYNGGPGRLDDYLTRNRPLPDETRRYVAKIGPHITDAFPSRRSTAEMYAMNVVPANIPSGPRYPVPTEMARALPAPASAPVEMAYAPPSDSANAAFDPPPGWTPKGMSRDEVAAYVPPPATPPAPSIPIPPPAIAEARAAEPRRAPEVFAAAPLPSEPPSARLAALPEPPPYIAPAPATRMASAAPATITERQGFRLVNPAVAAPAPLYRGTPGGWAIQVGAFGNEGLARIAVGAAKEQAGQALSGARPLVAMVREQHGTLYRARLEGLSRDAASEACERLSRSRTNCIVLSPDAQS